MENVNEEDLGRFAVIDNLDIILWDSDNILDCYNFYLNIGKEFCRGVYDYQQNKYIDEADIINITGCQINNE